MKTLRLILSSFIVTAFILKANRKLHEKPETKEDVYRRMKAEYNRRKREDMARISAVSTPRNGANIMAQMGTISNMEAAMRPCMGNTHNVNITIKGLDSD